MLDSVPSDKSLLIGIAGGTGSGKTTVARTIVASLPPGRAVMIQHDWYYHDLSELPMSARMRVNFDEPKSLDNGLLAKQLRQLKKGRAVECPQYDFTTHARLSETRRIGPHPIVVVEGILLFAKNKLREIFDLLLYVDTDDDIRLMRRIKRDILQRGRDIESIQRQYYDTVRPMHQRWVAPCKQHAHLVIPEGGRNREAVDVIVGRLLYTLIERERRGLS